MFYLTHDSPTKLISGRTFTNFSVNNFSELTKGTWRQAPKILSSSVQTKKKHWGWGGDTEAPRLRRRVLHGVHNRSGGESPIPPVIRPLPSGHASFWSIKWNMESETARYSRMHRSSRHSPDKQKQKRFTIRPLLVDHDIIYHDITEHWQVSGTCGLAD